MNPNIEQCYAILGVRYGAPADEVKQAYYDLVREWHPDRLQHDARRQRIAEERLKEINVAYERLKSHAPSDRHAYSPASSRTSRSARTGYSPHAAGRRRGAATAEPRTDVDEQTLYEQALAFYKEGQAQFEAGRWSEAVSSLMQAVCIKPNIGDAYFMLGRSYSELKLPAKAASAYKQVLRFQPDRLDAHDELARAYLAMGAPKDAVWTCSQVLKRRPRALAVRVTLGHGYRKLGQYAQSMEALTGAVEQDPSYAPAHYEMGETYLAMGNKEAARQVYAVLKPLDADLAVQLLLSIVGS